jgi:hypothetical protein
MPEQFGPMEISGASGAPASAGTLRLHTPSKVLGGEVDATVAAAAMPLETLSRIEPPGLLFSPTGLSAGSESRFIADL